MLFLNGKKFVRKSETIDIGDAVGLYKVNKKTITLQNIHGEKIGVITDRAVLACATKRGDGRWWYSHATIKEVGEHESYMTHVEEIQKALEDNGIPIRY